MFKHFWTATFWLDTFLAPSCSQVIRAQSAKGVGGDVFLKCRLSVCNHTESIHIIHLSCDAIQECFYPDPTSITSLSTIFIIIQLCHLPSLNLILPRAKSALPQKVIHCLHWWPVISLSSFSALPRRLQNVANRQLTPHFSYSIWTEHFHNESYQITWLHYTLNYSISVQLSPRHFHLWGRWNINPCTWSQTVQLSSAYSLHVYWFAVRSKPEQTLHTALHKS